MMISRRRFIAISAAAAFAPNAALGGQTQMQRWSGVAMGARASLATSGLTRSEFARLGGQVTAEIDRLENIFSLYRHDSELSRLNAVGTLDNPAGDFLRLLSLAGSINRATKGAFDPTIQPLWHAYARSEGSPGPDALKRARKLVGWKHVRFSESDVSFGRPGMAMTLNGIAQGYLTDRIADLLRDNGLNNVLVSIGEIMALGEREHNRKWQIGIADSEDGKPEEAVALTDLAIATSSPTGMSFGSGNKTGHIFDPHGGKPANHWRRVSVIDKSAAIADGLSTALCAMGELQIRNALKHFASARLIAIGKDGRRVTAQT